MTLYPRSINSRQCFYIHTQLSALDDAQYQMQKIKNRPNAKKLPIGAEK